MTERQQNRPAPNSETDDGGQDEVAPAAPSPSSNDPDALRLARQPDAEALKKELEESYEQFRVARRRWLWGVYLALAMGMVIFCWAMYRLLF